MRFTTDENLPQDAAVLLRQAGHDAQTVCDQHKGGQTDSVVASVCRRDGRSLVTLDVDFTNIRSYHPEEYPGLMVLRPRLQAQQYVLELLRWALPLLAREPLAGHLWIVDETGVRIR